MQGLFKEVISPWGPEKERKWQHIFGGWRVGGSVVITLADLRKLNPALSAQKAKQRPVCATESQRDTGLDGTW